MGSGDHPTSCQGGNLRYVHPSLARAVCNQLYCLLVRADMDDLPCMAAQTASGGSVGGEDSPAPAAAAGGPAEGAAGGQEEVADDEFGQALYEAEAQQYAQEVHTGITSSVVSYQFHALAQPLCKTHVVKSLSGGQIWTFCCGFSLKDMAALICGEARQCWRGALSARVNYKREILQVEGDEEYERAQGMLDRLQAAAQRDEAESATPGAVVPAGQGTMSEGLAGMSKTQARCVCGWVPVPWAGTLSTS